MKKLTWSQIQDQKEFQEKAAKEQSSHSPIVNKLKDEGRIREAAAVFSYEGFNFLLDTLGDMVASKVSTMIDQKIEAAFQGFSEGLTKAIQKEASSKIEKALGDHIDSFIPQVIKGGVGVKIKDEHPEATTSEEIELMIKEFINEPTEQDRKIEPIEPVEVIKENELYKEEQPKSKKSRAEDAIHTTFTGFTIPRNSGGGIRWKEIKDDHQLEQIFLHYMYLSAQDNDMEDVNTNTYKQSHPDGNSVYQRLCKSDFNFKELKELYYEKYHA